MKNTIANRIADFLKRYPPFDLLKKDDLIVIAKKITVKYIEKGQPIFNQGDAPHTHFYMVNKGAISLINEDDIVSEVIDKFDEGDVFGLRPLFAQENYASKAVTNEESILYCIPFCVSALVAMVAISWHQILVYRSKFNNLPFETSTLYPLGLFSTS